MGAMASIMALREAGEDRLRVTLVAPDGGELEYDSLVVATGAAAAATYPEPLTFSDTDPSCLHSLLHRIEHSTARRSGSEGLHVDVEPAGRPR
ncbi:hypothetical protein DSM104329_00786 [Capillimicrobium parvum]|uniref:FAD/NAD(P)-binding domain-containing protein n=2 Tax=Capillimicrobium parvum TaxID=2884022 RepID=A0A9E7BZH5_9ACTN|nr:hypothetical protein DSM104329_00786 [Capillimicrobium parvum]